MLCIDIYRMRHVPKVSTSTGLMVPNVDRVMMYCDIPWHDGFAFLYDKKVVGVSFYYQITKNNLVKLDVRCHPLHAVTWGLGKEFGNKCFYHINCTSLDELSMLWFMNDYKLTYYKTLSTTKREKNEGLVFLNLLNEIKDENSYNRACDIICDTCDLHLFNYHSWVSDYHQQVRNSTAQDIGPVVCYS